VLSVRRLRGWPTRQRAEDMQDAMALRGEARPTLSERFREWAALEELEAREDDGRRARRAEEQLAARTARGRRA
jgi:hypothetical protein